MCRGFAGPGFGAGTLAHNGLTVPLASGAALSLRYWKPLGETPVVASHLARSYVDVINNSAEEVINQQDIFHPNIRMCTFIPKQPNCLAHLRQRSR